MSKFSAEQRQEDGKSVLVLSGHIDEDANLESLQPTTENEIVIDFGNVTAINSCGIREWIKWLKLMPKEKKVTYVNCPKIIVDQANMVSGFIPDNGSIKSFFVPYYCESTDNEKMVLFSEGKEFTGSEVNPPEGVVDEESGEDMDMDVIEAKYFKFLHK